MVPRCRDLSEDVGAFSMLPTFRTPCAHCTGGGKLMAKQAGASPGPLVSLTSDEIAMWPWTPAMSIMDSSPRPRSPAGWPSEVVQSDRSGSHTTPGMERWRTRKRNARLMPVADFCLVASVLLEQNQLPFPSHNQHRWQRTPLSTFSSQHPPPLHRHSARRSATPPASIFHVDTAAAGILAFASRIARLVCLAQYIW